MSNIDSIILHREDEIVILRDEHGVPHVEARTEGDMYYGQGYVQAMDRGMQMLFTRILGQGRVSELLRANEETLELDIFFRKMNWRGDATEVVSTLSARALQLAEAWCAGINDRFKEERPWEFRYLGYYPDEWRVEDSVLISRMVGYIGLQQTQVEMERLLVELVQKGVTRELLEELFPGRLEGLDEEILKRVKVVKPVIPGRIPWNGALAGMVASNNWVINGRKTESGKPMMASDPHLEVNRLPNVWQEMVLKCQDRYLMGVGMPGLPGILMGRNNNLTWSATYAYMDSVDTWVEECREGKYRRGSRLKTQWARFRERREVIKRKRRSDYEAVFFENEHGILDGNPYEEGLYLATRWSGSAATGARSLESVFQMFHTDTVRDGMEVLGQIENGWNWLLADDGGNIGYQMSGLFPRKGGETNNGLVPLPGWEQRFDWKGFTPHKNLPRRYNPREGILVTANNDLNEFGKVSSITLPTASYRYDRISQLLSVQKKFSVEEMSTIQYDVYSLQAEKYMKILEPLLPDNEYGQILKDWDYCYSARSQGAYVFEKFYRALQEEVFGDNGPGREVMQYIAEETSLFTCYFANFDRILLSNDSLWFGDRSREEIYQAAVRRAFHGSIKTWGSHNRIYMNNIFFGGRFPRIFRLDRGPIHLSGGRSTPNQAQLFRTKNRNSSYSATYRMVADMDEVGLRTNLAGGPSDRPFSGLYASDLDNWLNARYKTLNP